MPEISNLPDANSGYTVTGEELIPFTTSIGGTLSTAHISAANLVPAVAVGSNANAGEILFKNSATDALTGNPDLFYDADNNDISYSSAESPSLTGIRGALDSLLYTAVTVTTFRLVSSNFSAGGTDSTDVTSDAFEYGATVKDLTATWDSSKGVDAAVDGWLFTDASTATTSGSHTYLSAISLIDYAETNSSSTQVTTSYSVCARDLQQATDTESAAVYWRNRMFYGQLGRGTAFNTGLNSTATQTVSANSLVTARTALGTLSLTMEGSAYYIAYPSSFGDPSDLTINGLSNTDFNISSFTYTNAHGINTTYKLLSGSNFLTGTYTIVVN